jgi:hypothetical protein
LNDSAEDIVSKSIIEASFYPAPKPTESFATLPKDM